MSQLGYKVTEFMGHQAIKGFVFHCQWVVCSLWWGKWPLSYFQQIIVMICLYFEKLIQLFSKNVPQKIMRRCSTAGRRNCSDCSRDLMLKLGEWQGRMITVTRVMLHFQNGTKNGMVHMWVHEKISVLKEIKRITFLHNSKWWYSV